MTTPREGDPWEVTGTVGRIRYEADDGDFQVVLVRASGAEIAAVVRGAALREGERVELRGRAKRTRRGELQLDAESVHRVLPKTAEGMASYLASGLVPGVGQKRAADIVRVFGDATFDVLDATPERLREVPGIGRKTARAIGEVWGTQRAVREILTFLQSHGISPAYASRIFRTYGPRAVRVVQEDPYRLARDVHGIGFRSADRIARAVGISESDPRRLDAGVVFTLAQAAGEGHVFLDTESLRATAAALIGVGGEDVGAAIDRLVGRREVTRDAVARCALPEVDSAELRLGALVGRRAATPVLWAVGDDEVAAIEATLSFTLAPGQRAALRSVGGRALAVLTGGPGTGKTTMVRALVAAARRQRKHVELAAPTGRAAKRIAESTGVEARTLHRLLAYDPRTGLFARTAEDPVAADFVIVDEASMLDQDLALALVSSLRPDTALLLVGDVEQLPSVGAGDVLADVIRSGTVTVARLDRVFRQVGTSQILDCAHEIREGRLPRPSDRADGDFFFIEARDAEHAVEVVCRLVTERMPRAFGLRVPDEIQVLTPMHAGPLGTHALNEALQRALGAGGPALARGDRRLHAADRVMQVRNNYDLDVFNGDIGTVVAIDPEEVTATVRFDDRVVRYDRESLDELVLAYAVSVHKSQGSEFPGVILVLTHHHFKLLQRNLLYTAVTRARERLVIVGTRRALAAAVSNEAAARRNTRLAERVRSALADSAPA